MWKLSDALLAFAVIALITGAILMLCFILQDDDALKENDSHTLSRSTLLLLTAIALALFVIVFQKREGDSLIKSMLSGN